MMAVDYKRAGDNITPETHYKAAGRLYKCFCANGGPYVKMGQLVGQLQSLVPDEYLEVFEPMCMQAPTTLWPEVKKTLESELGRPVHEVFEMFEERPFASASLGQVHRAKLMGTGELVVVKV
jgi:aarF domain-containing kinase